MHQFLSEFPPPPTTKVPIGVLHVMNAAAPNTIFVMFPKSSFINDKIKQSTETAKEKKDYYYKYSNNNYCSINICYFFINKK